MSEPVARRFSVLPKRRKLARIAVEQVKRLLLSAKPAMDKDESKRKRRFPSIFRMVLILVIRGEFKAKAKSESMVVQMAI